MNDYYSQTASYPSASSQGSGWGVLVFLVIVVVIYIYFSYSLYVMAKKTGVSDPWMAWVPLLNAYILIKVAGKPGWWFFLCLVPLLNIVIGFVIWYNVALRLNKPGWLGILVAILPILVGFLAFGDSNPPVVMPAPPAQPPMAS